MFAVGGLPRIIKRRARAVPFVWIYVVLVALRAGNSPRGARRKSVSFVSDEDFHKDLGRGRQTTERFGPPPRDRDIRKADHRRPCYLRPQATTRLPLTIYPPTA